MDDYVAQTELTASNVFNPAQVGVNHLAQALRTFSLAGRELDKFKKALFRQRSAEEAGVPDTTGQTNALVHYIEPQDTDLLHGIIGVCTEAGELADAMLLYFQNDGTSDKLNIQEEIGDVLWYLARLIKWADTSFDAEQRRNIAKLRKRHGTAGFNAQADANRDLDAERKILEDGAL